MQKLAGLKTVGLVELWATFDGRFLKFFGKKKILKFLKKYCSVPTKKLHKMQLRNI